MDKRTKELIDSRFEWHFDTDDVYELIKLIDDLVKFIDEDDWTRKQFVIRFLDKEA